MTSHDVGRGGEDLAAAWYEANGYRILDRNWRIRAGELDIVAATGTTVVFCEVKTRSTGLYGTGAEAVDRHKQRKVRGLAVAWLQASSDHFDEIRFDVAAVDGGDIELIEGCF